MGNSDKLGKGGKWEKDDQQRTDRNGKLVYMKIAKSKAR